MSKFRQYGSSRASASLWFLNAKINLETIQIKLIYMLKKSSPVYIKVQIRLFYVLLDGFKLSVSAESHYADFIHRTIFSCKNYFLYPVGIRSLILVYHLTYNWCHIRSPCTSLTSMFYFMRNFRQKLLKSSSFHVILKSFPWQNWYNI